MSLPPKTRTEWLTPQNFFVVVAAAWGIYGSYIGFQKDTTVQIARMDERLKAMERGCK